MKRNMLKDYKEQIQDVLDYIQFKKYQQEKR